jgi:hypothetical protein
MRKGFIILITFTLLFILIGFPLAKEESGNIEKPAKSGEGHKGDKGLCFSVSGLSSVGIGQYEGGIGGKYWVSNKLAIVSSIGGNAQRRTRSASVANYTDDKSTSSTCSFFAGLEDHFFRNNRISPYLGGGLHFSISNASSYQSLPKDNPPPTAAKKVTNNFWSYGVRGFCGIEFFFTDWVSLSGQYQIDYYSTKSTAKTILVGGQGVTQPKEMKYTANSLSMGTSVLVATFYIW